MLLGRLLQAEREFEQIRLLVAEAHRFREEREAAGGSAPNYFASVDGAYWRSYDYCAAIVRVYATFERFMYDCLEQWIAWCLLSDPDLLLLHEPARRRYETGVAEILRRPDDPRFETVDLGRLGLALRLFHSAERTSPIELPIEPFMANQPNLKFEQIQKLFQGLNLGDPSAWIREYPSVQQACLNNNVTVDSELKDLVQRRNDAAHGNELPTDILGANEIALRVEVCAGVCRASFEYLLWKICARVEAGLGQAVVLGAISHLWPNNNAFQIEVAQVPISVNDQVIFLSQSRAFCTTVQTLQVEGVATQQFNGGVGTQLGATAAELPKEGMRMVRVDSIANLATVIAIP